MAARLRGSTLQTRADRPPHGDRPLRQSGRRGPGLPALVALGAEVLAKGRDLLVAGAAGQEDHAATSAARRRGRARIGATCTAWSLCILSAAAWAAPALAAGAAFDIEAIDVDGNTLLDESALGRAIYPHLGPGRTEADVAAAQKDLEDAYRARGYQSVVVEVPRQTIDQGLVKLHVVETPIGRVRVVGSKYHSLAAVEAGVPALAPGQVANFQDAQAQINEVNRLPDRQVTPVVRAGEAPGTIDVDLKVVDEAPLHGSVELNNESSAFTKPLRLTANVRYDNLWQLGHSISATYEVAPQRRQDGEVFAGSYMAPLWGSPFSLLMFGFNSNSDLATLGGVSVLGKGYDVGARAVYQFPTAGPISQSLSIGIDYKHFDEFIRLTGGQESDGAVSYAPLSATYTLRLQQTSTTTASVAITANPRGLGDGDVGFQTKRANARANFIRTNVDIEHTRPLWAGFEGNVRLSGQMASTALVSSEQFAMGGANSVRGYLEAETVADNGAFGSVELRTPRLLSSASRFVDNLRLFSFFDAAAGSVIQPQAEQQGSFTLLSAGLGARVRLLDHLDGDLFAAVPLKSGPSRVDRGRPYGTFSLKAEF